MIRNERVKLFANFVSAIGLGLIALAVLRPLIETGSENYWQVAVWAMTGLALHGLSHYILGNMS
jgi:hypothetical protein